MDGQTPIQYHPAVFWLMGDASDSYRQTWDLILEEFHNSALRGWWRANPTRGSEANTSEIIFFAVASLQNKILDQRINRLSPDALGSVTFIWPGWEKSGIPVELESGILDRIVSPFPDDEQNVKRQFSDGRGYEFKFFLTNTKPRRDRWFRHILRQTARSHNSKPSVDFDQPSSEPIEPRALQKQLDDRLMLREIRAIVDSKDYDWIESDRDPVSQAETAEKYRALRNLRTAGQIILRSSDDDGARRFHHLLKETVDGARRPVLANFRTRFLDKNP